ncbi:MAG: peptide chain release factor N(5)-glutamine methyltransferase [Alphaproteobacteria bacterium]
MTGAIRTHNRAEVIARGAARLAGAGVPEPERDARLLYRWAADMDGAGLSAALADPATAREIGRFERAVVAREGRAPVSHITGMREFWGRCFRVTPAVLDPRPETETLVAAALEGPPVRRVLDLGTGSGCILLTLLAEWPEARGVGVDISAAALEVAASNARSLGLSGRAGLVTGDWCAGLAGSGGQFGLIVSNPPYIAGDELAGLAPEVRNHEPLAALSPGGDGLDAYRRISAGVGSLMASGGRLLMEIGPRQAAAVERILTDAGLVVTAVLPDLDGRDRVVSAEI